MLPLDQGPPTPGPWTSTGPQPVRNQAAQQEVSGGRASKQSFICHSPSLALPPEPSPPHLPWKNCLPRNRSLVPKRLGTAALNIPLMCVNKFPCYTIQFEFDFLLLTMQRVLIETFFIPIPVHPPHNSIEQCL